MHGSRSTISVHGHAFVVASQSAKYVLNSGVV